jgi:hypothetical protein
MLSFTRKRLCRGKYALAIAGTTAALFSLGGCRPSQTGTGSAAMTTAEPNTLTAAEQAAGWRLLFDGRTTAGWRGYKSETVPAAWQVVDGALRKETATGDIMAREQFGDFELHFDWMIGPAGNAGVFYRATEEYDKIYWSAPEYQLLDDVAAPDRLNRLTAAGSAYALYPAPAGIVKPANEWNTARIVVNRSHVEHWLNQQKLLEYDLDSPDWKAKIQASKFNDYPNFARAQRGYIGIQGDHAGMLALRNIKIRPL